MYRKIICDWFLTEGITPPVRLDSPMYVEEALISAGRIPSETTYEQHTAYEWIYRREWSYITRFATPGGGRRVFLRASGLKGAWQMFINGALACEGKDSLAEFEITAGAKEENELEIRFAPPDARALMPVTGFSGMLSFRTTGAAAITGIRLTEDSCVAVDLDLSRKAECEISVNLKNSVDSTGESVTQSLDMGYNSLLLCSLDGQLVSEEANEIEVSVSEGGALSDRRELITFIPSGGVQPRGFIGEGEEILSLGETAGAISAFTLDSEPALPFRLMAARHGLESLSAEELDVYTAPPALLPEDMLLDIAGSPDRLERSEMWRLTGSDKRPYDEAKAAVPSGTLGRITALSRYRQAEAVRAEALEARIGGRYFVIGSAQAQNGVPASCALSDGQGRLRPAYYALIGAWQDEVAYVKAPTCVAEDGIVSLEVCLACDRELPHVDSVNVEAYDAAGWKIASNSFPALAQGCIGRFTLELPKDGIAILRACLVKGEESRISTDEVLFTQGVCFEDAPLTQLLASDGKITNVGQSAALGVCVPGAGYFGCLLPGESVTAGNGDPNEIEGLNIFM